MYQQFTRYKILKVFFDEPNHKFQLREIERLTSISLPSVKQHVQALLKQGYLQQVKSGVYHSYVSSMNERYRILKRNDLLLRLYECDLVRELEEQCTPNCIILYGSSAEGRDDERGDVDIFVQSKLIQIDMKTYEKKIKRKINLLFEPRMEKIENSFKNTLANGIVLSGFFKVI